MIPSPLHVRPFSETDMESFPELWEMLKKEGISKMEGIILTATNIEGTPEAIGGLVSMGGGTCEAWFSCRKDLSCSKVELVWRVRQYLLYLMKLHGFHRVQARIRAEDKTSVRFIKALRFYREGTMSAYWYKEDRDLYARILP